MRGLCGTCGFPRSRAKMRTLTDHTRNRLTTRAVQLRAIWRRDGKRVGHPDDREIAESGRVTSRNVRRFGLQFRPQSFLGRRLRRA